MEKIPLLEREDIEKKALPFQNEVYPVGDVQVVHHDLYTNGIGYVNLMFRAGEIPKRLVPYLGLLKAVLGNVDTEHYTYGEFAAELNLHTGGISCGVNSYESLKEPGTFTAMFEVRCKALYEELPKAFSMIEEMLLTSKLRDRKRLTEVSAETRSRLQMVFTTAGHSMAALRAMSYFSESSCFADETGGVAFYEFMEREEAALSENWEQIAGDLEELVHALFRKENLTVSYTAEKKSLEDLKRQVENLLLKLYDMPAGKEHWSLTAGRKNEGLKTSSQIQYVARAGSFGEAGLPYTGALSVLRTIMGYDYLWNNVRVKGGAYGCMNNYTRNGSGYMVSYRDPNLEKTNRIFEESVEYVEHFEVSERDMTKYIIGTMSSLDTPLNPNSKGMRSMSAWLQGLEEETVQRERDQVLTCESKDIRALAPYLKAVLSQKHICVIGNEAKLEEQKELFETVRNLFH